MTNTIIEPNAANYPSRLRQRLGEACPPLTIQGPTAWLSGTSHPTIALFSSVKAPARLILQAHEVAQQWRAQSVTIISGFQSPLEDEVWSVLIQDIVDFRNPPPAQVGPRLIKVLARSMVTRLSAREHHAIATGALAVVSPFPASVKRTTSATALPRNLVVAALADRVVVGHAEEGSRTAQLVQQIHSWNLPIAYLAHKP